jgi:flagellar protein FliO/FliZ
MESGGYYQSIIVIFVILGFLALVLFAVKKYGIKFGMNRLNQNKDFCLEDHISLGPKRDACIVRYKEKKFLLGVTDHRISLISVIEDLKDKEE